MLAKFGVEEFVVDGVIIIKYVGIGGLDFGNLQIRKMRRTKHETGWYPMNITQKGIVIKAIEKKVLMK